jgi:cytolysin (calcineurin-like family phosphatase)
MEFDPVTGVQQYTVRCDKHNLKPYEYCEMCMLRSRVQDTVEDVRKDTQYTLANTHLSISVLNDCFAVLEKRLNKVQNELQGEINLLTDRVIALEKLAAVNMFPRKICGMCSGTGQVFYGTMFDPPVGACGVCKGKGFI